MGWVSRLIGCSYKKFQRADATAMGPARSAYLGLVSAAFANPSKKIVNSYKISEKASHSGTRAVGAQLQLKPREQQKQTRVAPALG
ncbi:hypothetical protein APED_03535 [Acanthopleuribacter pedis]